MSIATRLSPRWLVFGLLAATSVNAAAGDACTMPPADDGTRYPALSRPADAAPARLRRLRGSDRSTRRLPPLADATPAIAAAPAEAYDLLYADAGYAAFRSRYRHRRHVIYTTSRDGRLHAFNAGFADAHRRTPQRRGHHGEPPHPLGAELWTFTPFERLPQRAAPHDVAASLRLFDVRTFPTSDRHPHGWGTLLVVGLYGPLGRHLPPNPGFAASDDPPAGITVGAAYLLFDVTDPESTPRLLASLRPPGLGDAGGAPIVVPVRNGQDDHWYLLFGNARAARGQPARLWAYDLRHHRYVDGWAPRRLPAADSRVGAAVAVDWNLDFSADAIYLGTADAQGGGTLLRIKLDAGSHRAAAQWSPPEVLVDPQRPVLVAPNPGLGLDGQRWVFAATGPAPAARSPGCADAGAQQLFGIIDHGVATVDPAARYTALVETRRVRITSNRRVAGLADIADEPALLTAVDAAGGWRLTLPRGERLGAPLLLAGSLLLAATHQADGGSSRLWALHHRSGAARAGLPPLGLAPGAGDAAGQDVRRAIDLGPGRVNSLRLEAAARPDGGGAHLLIGTDEGHLHHQPLQLDATMHSGEIDWRERRP